jgi:predicted nuclease with RNAse H fold
MPKFRHYTRQVKKLDNAPSRYVKVNNIPATWVDTPLTISDNEARENFLKHRDNNINALKQTPRLDNVDFFK